MFELMHSIDKQQIMKVCESAVKFLFCFSPQIANSYFLDKICLTNTPTWEAPATHCLTSVKNSHNSNLLSSVSTQSKKCYHQFLLKAQNVIISFYSQHKLLSSVSTQSTKCYRQFLLKAQNAMISFYSKHKNLSSVSTQSTTCYHQFLLKLQSTTCYHHFLHKAQSAIISFYSKHKVSHRHLHSHRLLRIVDLRHLEKMQLNAIWCLIVCFCVCICLLVCLFVNLFICL